MGPSLQSLFLQLSQQPLSAWALVLGERWAQVGGQGLPSWSSPTTPQEETDSPRTCTRAFVKAIPLALPPWKFRLHLWGGVGYLTSTHK